MNDASHGTPDGISPARKAADGGPVQPEFPRHFTPEGGPGEAAPPRPDHTPPGHVRLTPEFAQATQPSSELRDAATAPWPVAGSPKGVSAAGKHPSSPRTKSRVGIAPLVLSAVLGGALASGGTIAANKWLAPESNGSVSVGKSDSNGPLIINNPDTANTIAAAATKATPSVVTIAVGDSTGMEGGNGSGVVIDDQGYILTNTHVVTLGGTVSDPTIQVQDHQGKVYDATIVGEDPMSDMAVIKVEGANLTPIEWGSSSDVNVGDTAIAIGAPLGLSNTVTDGIVSALNRTISVESAAAPEATPDQGGPQGSNPWNFRFAPPGNGSQMSSNNYVHLNVMQTDAAINPGNSGGALVDGQGRLIGINVAIASAPSQSGQSSASGNIGVGFALPSDYAKRISQELIETGKAAHGQLGVKVSSTDSNAFKTGVKVAQVPVGSQAEKAGLKAGDVITKVGGNTITDFTSLVGTTIATAPGTEVEVVVLRDGQEMKFTVKVSPAGS